MTLLDTHGVDSKGNLPREKPRILQSFSRKGTLKSFSRFGIVWATVAMFTILAATTPGFIGVDNLLNVLDQQSIVLIVAAPLTLTLIAGHFDVSVSAVFITAPLVGIQLEIASGSIPLAIMGGLIAGILCGLFNSFLVVRCRINSFISTLASSYIIVGVGYLVSEQSILTPTSPGFREFASTHFLGITSAAWMAIAVVVIFWILLSSTRYGRYVYATGANPDAAKLSGIRTGRIVTSTFVMTGAAAAFAGIVNASQSMSAQASDDFSDSSGCWYRCLQQITPTCLTRSWQRREPRLPSARPHKPRQPNLNHMWRTAHASTEV
jgi:ribose transport system permease protein